MGIYYWISPSNTLAFMQLYDLKLAIYFVILFLSIGDQITIFWQPGTDLWMHRKTCRLFLILKMSLKQGKYMNWVLIMTQAFTTLAVGLVDGTVGQLAIKIATKQLKPDIHKQKCLYHTTWASSYQNIRSIDGIIFVDRWMKLFLNFTIFRLVKFRNYFNTETVNSIFFINL